MVEQKVFGMDGSMDNFVGCSIFRQLQIVQI